MPAFSNAFRSPCLDTGPLAWGPLSSGGCGENMVCPGFTEEDDMQGSIKSSTGSLAEELIFSLFA